MLDDICTHLRAARSLVGDHTLTAQILDALIKKHCYGEGPMTTNGPGPNTPPPEPTPPPPSTGGDN